MNRIHVWEAVRYDSMRVIVEIELKLQSVEVNTGRLDQMVKIIINKLLQPSQRRPSLFAQKLKGKE